MLPGQMSAAQGVIADPRPKHTRKCAYGCLPWYPVIPRLGILRATLMRFVPHGLVRRAMLLPVVQTKKATVAT